MLFRPLSLPTGTTTTVLPISPDQLACSLDYTRFLPFGYKEITFQPEQHIMDPPARIYWQVPARYKSLEQIKFLTTPERSAYDTYLHSPGGRGGGGG